VPGALAWNELASTDVDASGEFYRELFGWQTEPMEGPTPYLIIKTSDGRMNGGIRPAMENEPSYWLVYFGADDIDARLASAGELGGTAVVGVTDIGMGKIAVVRDPQGAVFAMFSGQFDD
jgi:uncharacterized protein